MQGSWLVTLQQSRPLPGVGWVADGERGEDGDPDRIRYLITPPEPPVTAVGGKRYDDPYQRAEYRDHQGNCGINEKSAGQARGCAIGRRLQQLGLDLATRIARGTDIIDIAISDCVGICRRIGTAFCCYAHRNDIRSLSADVDFAA